MKVLHAFEKFEEFKGVIRGQFQPFQLSDALPLLGEMVPAQQYMPSNHCVSRRPCCASFGN
ncbi:MAG: hypothetical protein EOQ52_06955 [Mesorhizobium sp.]|uniref:hypothetical protein n=1 Tax=Mesorhizobium sp. TaxID=1871066 RepID=UPI000FE498E9|nr:hypothetical protein [Mesorhizobium sp.]RWB91159.1 MAG: hypothetical protein EOQ52_06955 [Mesorhizobium sp.]